MHVFGCIAIWLVVVECVENKNGDAKADDCDDNNG